MRALVTNFGLQNWLLHEAAACHACVHRRVSPAWHGMTRLGVQVFCRQKQAEFGYYRDFVAASYPGLWAKYRNLRARHFYEVRLPRPMPSGPQDGIELAVSCSMSSNVRCCTSGMLDFVAASCPGLWAQYRKYRSLRACHLYERSAHGVLRQGGPEDVPGRACHLYEQSAHSVLRQGAPGDVPRLAVSSSCSLSSPSLSSLHASLCILTSDGLLRHRSRVGTATLANTLLGTVPYIGCRDAAACLLNPSLLCRWCSRDRGATCTLTWSSARPRTRACRGSPWSMSLLPWSRKPSGKQSPWCFPD